MHIDNSYTPLRADFDQFIADCFDVRPSAAETDLLKSVFYAGASSAYGILVGAPSNHETLRDELADQMERLETVKLKV